MAQSVAVNARKIDKLLFERRYDDAGRPKSRGKVGGHGCKAGRTEAITARSAYRTDAEPSD